MEDWIPTPVKDITKEKEWKESKTVEAEKCFPGMIHELNVHLFWNDGLFKVLIHSVLSEMATFLTKWSTGGTYWLVRGGV